MPRFYRLSLHHYGYQNEIFEFLHYTEGQCGKVHHLRDGLISEVSIYALLPLPSYVHNAFVEDAKRTEPCQQLELFT